MDFIGTIWQSFSNLLLNILVAINSVVHVPGIAIIIFTILMRFLTVPLTMKALRSSRNMQQIQPLIKEVQKKYGKDKQKQQEETMKLYRDYGINPAAGCLPMLIQLPIFFGLFSALTFTLEHGNKPEMLRQVLWVEDWITSGVANFSQSFLWVPNLAIADPTWIWPVLSGLFQFIQSRMAMPRKDPNNPLDPQQRMMQNIMQFMPIYIVVISINFPAGTVIYWAFSSLFGAVQQYFITGFGSLPDLPGMGFLPYKPIEPPKPLHPEQILANTNKRKGVMAKMMDKALEAQEAQKAAQPQTAVEARAGVTSDAPTVASLKSGGSTRNRSSGASSALARQVRATATTATGDAPRFTSSNFAVVEDNKANGAKAPAQLPRKRKNKR